LIIGQGIFWVSELFISVSKVAPFPQHAHLVGLVVAAPVCLIFIVNLVHSSLLLLLAARHTVEILHLLLLLHLHGKSVEVGHVRSTHHGHLLLAHIHLHLILLLLRELPHLLLVGCVYHINFK